MVPPSALSSLNPGHASAKTAAFMCKSTRIRRKNRCFLSTSGINPGVNLGIYQVFAIFGLVLTVVREGDINLSRAVSGPGTVTARCSKRLTVVGNEVV